MKESYGEGRANHIGPESCGPGREARYEALTGELWAGKMSREIPKLQDADALTRSGRQHPPQRHRQLLGSPARSKTLARSHASCRKLGDPRFARGQPWPAGRMGKSKDWSL